MLLGSTAATGSGCATILYPERKGNAGGGVDVVPLVLDILWFLAGIIPGVIALVVDFSTGAIYVGGGKRASRGRRLAIRHGEVISVRCPEVDAPTRARLRLLDAEERVLDQCETVWGTPDARLSVSFEGGHRGDRGCLELAVQQSDGTLRSARKKFVLI